MKNARSSFAVSSRCISSGLAMISYYASASVGTFWLLFMLIDIAIRVSIFRSPSALAPAESRFFMAMVHQVTNQRPITA